MNTGPIRRRCRQLCLILVVAAGETEAKIDRSFESFPETAVCGRDSNHVELIDADYVGRRTNNEVCDFARVRRQEAHHVGYEFAVDQPDHERRFALDALDLRPIETHRFGHVVSLDAQLTALQSLDLSG